MLACSGRSAWRSWSLPRQRTPKRRGRTLLAQWDKMDKAGILPVADRHYLDEARANAAKDGRQMTYAFISYKREDEGRVGRIAHALEQAGIEVWWDRGLPGGESWQEMITEKLDAAGCVIVVWSLGSIAPEGVLRPRRGQAGPGPGRACAGDHRPRPDLAAGLRRGAGDRSHPLARRRPRPLLPRPRGSRPSQAGRCQIARIAKGPAARVRRRFLFGGVSATTLAVFVILAINAFGVTAKICTVPGLQPSLSDACGALRLGNRPNRVERIAWEQLPKGNCAALRTYVLKYPESPPATKPTS